MANHLGEARRHPKTRKELWLSALLKRGLKPTVEVLETTTIEESSEAEKRWAKLFSQVAPLLNDERVGAGNPGIGRVDWTPELISLLGKIADSRIAKMIGCERKTVSYKRECLGIEAAFDRTNSTPPPPMGGWNKLKLPADIITRLGTEPDYVLANEIGCEKTVIARARRGAGIKDYAAETGNDGKFAFGQPHRRWKDRAQKQEEFSRSPDSAQFVSDAVLEEIAPFFPPPPKHGLLDIENRSVLRGVLWVLRSGIKWQDLPASLEAGSGSAVLRRLRGWHDKGYWPGIERALRVNIPNAEEFDWSRVTFTRYKRRDIS